LKKKGFSYQKSSQRRPSAKNSIQAREILKLPPLKNGLYLPSQDNHGE
jgi:hypothetical protein